MNIKYNESRLAETFIRLTEIDSESFNEKKMADFLKEALVNIGFEVTTDDADKKCGSNTGNLYGFMEGELPGDPILFSAHMDTVVPGVGKRAIMHEDGTVTSAGDTVLGADDAAGIAAILEAARSLREQQIPHRSIEVIFPVAEEAYVQGSSVFDYSRVRSKEAYCLDLEAPIGTASLGEPTLISFEITLEGAASHAGFAPEKGINAIAMAGELISGIKQGRIGYDTTVNIGQISGGTATNIVAAEVKLKGEIRSYVHEKAVDMLENIKRFAEQTASAYGGKASITSRMNLVSYCVYEYEPVARRFAEACDRLGIKAAFTRTFGGSDNNSFLRGGIRGIVTACGMHRVHTTEEYTTIGELGQSTAILIELMTSVS
jgi:tripeptide aminopeptidase